MTIAQDKTRVIYPDCDGNPMSDNTKQFRWIVVIKENLEILFADNPDVFIAGDLLWYPQEGNNRIRQAPDVVVAFGRPKGDRGSYRQWEENDISPQVVFEILSPRNRLKEMAKKLKFYDQYGVEEYYIFDPDRLDFHGWLRNPDGTLGVIEQPENWQSPRLGIRFELQDEQFTIYHPNGDRFLTPTELAKQSESQRQEAESQRQRAEAAEERVRELEARLRELGGDRDNEET
ncbi:Uma2 family endonuclease [Sodalinema gerasimenkoae]|uniref:Uma2 family endonuclease n=1 Tax=Sodalinema gerasimenkoae TaxID=2862348 RepID=UPI0013573447|nr:Uma2 family endonuclease [Sodalinema gerasimenkoae]